MSSGIHFNVNLKNVYMTMTPVWGGYGLANLPFYYIRNILKSWKLPEKQCSILELTTSGLITNDPIDKIANIPVGT